MPEDRASLEGRCGNCGYFHSVRFDADKGVNVGECSYGTWPPVRPETSSCPAYIASGQLAHTAPVKIRRAVHGRARDLRDDEVELEPAPRAPVEIEVDMDEATFRTVLREILSDELGITEVSLGDRWRGGEVVLRPGKEGTQEKRFPIDALFHKLVMVRDKLRLLEAKINGNSTLADDEKLTLQQYITGAYGSLTTFNVLFKDDRDRFVGQ